MSTHEIGSDLLDTPPKPQNADHTEEFKCPRRHCNYESQFIWWRWPQLPLNVKILWHTVLGPSFADCCIVKCPECACDVVQCRHCDHNFEASVPQKHGNKNPEIYFTHNHLKTKHPDIHRAIERPGLCTLLGGCASGGSAFTDDDDEYFLCGDTTLNDRHCDDNDDDDDDEVSLIRKEDLFPSFTQQCNISPNNEVSLWDDHLDWDMDNRFRNADERDSFEQWLANGTAVPEEDQQDEHLPSKYDSPADQSQLTYHDFRFFDKREQAEKRWRKNSFQETINQNQTYFYQKHEHMAKQKKKQQQPSTPMRQFASSKQSLQSTDGLGGFCGLVHRANERNREDSTKIACPREASVLLRELWLLLQLSGHLKEDLIEFQNEILTLFNVVSAESNVVTNFPTDINEVRSMLLDGSNSVMKNFPVPKVFSIDGKHAMVGLEETIQIAAGHGARFSLHWNAQTGEQNREGLNGTKAVEELMKDVKVQIKNAVMPDIYKDVLKKLQEELQIDELTDEKMKDLIAANGERIEKALEEEITKTSRGYIKFWSDSFLRCFIKQRENSVWILTVTICPPENVKSSGVQTHVLAMGKSGEDHTPIIEHYLKEAQKLMKGFPCYFGDDTNAIGRLAVGMLAWNADRPERQMASCTRKEGIWGLVSMWAARVSKDKFPACDKCYRRRLRQMMSCVGTEEDSLTCEQCFDWTLDPEVEVQKTAPADKNYPTTLPVGYKGNIPDGRKPGMKFLGPVRQNQKFMRDACMLAYEARRMGCWTKGNVEEYLRCCNINAKTIEKIEETAFKDYRLRTSSKPEEYLPGIFVEDFEVDLFERNRLPDLPMHGLAHGIIPDTMDIVHVVLGHHKKYAAFMNFANETLDDIGTFRLDYCKAKSLPKSAWVAENSMAYMRVFPYLVGMFLSNYPLATPETEKTRETVSNLKCMLNALQALMSVLMSMDKPDKATIDDHMKVFMSSAHHLQKRYGSLSKNSPDSNNLVNKLSKDDLVAILDAFPESKVSGGLIAMRKAVKKITLKSMKDKCIEYRISTDKMLKAEVQVNLFQKIVGHSICQGDEGAGGEGEEGIEQDAEQAHSKFECCWMKGNWLSFVVNIAQQCDHMGRLMNLW